MLLFFTTLGLVFAAEMGDKTQLVAMAFAAKYKPWKVMLGTFISISLLNIIAVLLGTSITKVVPLNAIRVCAAVMFLLFGLLNLKEDNEEEKDRNFKFGAIATVALTFFIGELGDKTQLMTITQAAKYNEPYLVFAGSTAGMLLADSLGIIIGSTLFKKIPEMAVKLVSSSVFIVFGFIGLYNSVPPRYMSPVFVICFILLFISAIALISGYNKKIRRLKSDTEQ
jgi:Predicted membrane protein